VAKETELEEIDFIVADLERFTRLEVVALTLNIDANLRDSPPGGTPIDTGWASANWVPSIGEPKFLDSDDKDPSSADIAARAAVADTGRNALLAWKPVDGAIFITNSVPYIQPLNNGHSAQSPRGFVQIAIEKAIRMTYSAGGSKAARARRAGKARAAKRRPR
jgi:hypothetical protein